MEAHGLPQGQRDARTRWGTHTSGAAFDQKKTPFLTEQAQQLLAQQAFSVIAGPGPQQHLTGLLAMMTVGDIQTSDRYTCVLHLDNRYRYSPIVQGLHQTHRAGRMTPLGFFFINHATRQRLCVQGMAELVAETRPLLLCPSASQQKFQVRLHVQQAFFHCSKYIRTRVAGLTVPVDRTSEPLWEPERLLAKQGQHALLTETIRTFVAQQMLCFLCTREQQGRYAVNHRGGAPGFLVPLPPSSTSSGGIILLPDYAGNGAFEAIGNLLETRQAALVIPNYSSQVALCLSGPAYPSEVHELSADLAERCPGAQRIIALWVQHIELQHGDWSATLAYEQARAQAILTRSLPTLVCSP